jgi:hypothetical protein
MWPRILFLITVACWLPTCLNAQVGCTEDFPPAPSRPTAAWTASYSAWCARHGGTFYYASGSPACNPGPNWCKGPNAASSGTSSDLTNVLTSAILSKDPGIRNAGLFSLGALITLNILTREKKPAVPARTPVNPSVRVAADPIADLRRQQWEKMYAELKASLKMTGSQPDVALKGISAPLGLKLKSGSGELLAGGYGICGLPGLYVGGSRPDCPEGGGLQLKLSTPSGGASADRTLSTNDPDNGAGPNTPYGNDSEIGGLKLKLGSAESSPQLSGSAVANQNGVEGLPLKVGSHNAATASDQAASLPSGSGLDGATGNRTAIAPNQVPPNQVPSNEQNNLIGNLDPAALDRKIEDAKNLGAAAGTAKTDEEASALARRQFENAANLPPSSLTRDQPAVAASTAAVVKIPAATTTIPSNATEFAAGNSITRGAGVYSPPAPGSLPVVDPNIIQSADLVDHGSPIFDCDGDRAKLKRLQAGRPAQLATIDRTEALLEGSGLEKDFDAAKEDAWQAATQLLTDASLISVLHSRTLLARTEMMKNTAGTLPPVAARWKLLQSEKELLEDAHDLEDAIAKLRKLPGAYNAGEAYGNVTFVQHKAHALKDRVAEFNKLLKDSGLREELLKQLGENTAKATFGDIGAAEFNSLTDVIDLAASLYQMSYSGENAAKLRGALNGMRAAQLQTSGRIAELQLEIQKECDARRQAEARP